MRLYEITQDIAELEELINNEELTEDEVTEVKTMIESVMGIVNVVSLVLIALVAISLVVSSIMIAIITYISVIKSFDFI